MTREENDRQYRLIDQMTTMHSVLRDRYARQAFLLNSGLLVASIFLNAFVFVDDKFYSTVGLKPDIAKLGLGISSIVVLGLSIIEFRVDWEGKASEHGEAAERFAALKSKYRQVYAATKGDDPKKNQSLSREFEKLHKTLTPIPEVDFPRLKAKHLVKRTLSERISRNPKAPVWFLMLQLRYEGIRQAFEEGRHQTDRESR